MISLLKTRLIALKNENLPGLFDGIISITFLLDRLNTLEFKVLVRLLVTPISDIRLSGGSLTSLTAKLISCSSCMSVSKNKKNKFNLSSFSSNFFFVWIYEISSHDMN